MLSLNAAPSLPQCAWAAWIEPVLSEPALADTHKLPLSSLSGRRMCEIQSCELKQHHAYLVVNGVNNTFHVSGHFGTFSESVTRGIGKALAQEAGASVITQYVMGFEVDAAPLDVTRALDTRLLSQPHL